MPQIPTSDCDDPDLDLLADWLSERCIDFDSSNVDRLIRQYGGDDHERLGRLVRLRSAVLAREGSAQSHH